MRISDWSSDVCSSDLLAALLGAVCLPLLLNLDALAVQHLHEAAEEVEDVEDRRRIEFRTLEAHAPHRLGDPGPLDAVVGRGGQQAFEVRQLLPDFDQAGAARLPRAADELDKGQRAEDQ